MNEITIDGKTFVKASEIARHLGYTSDYVGQLCRAGKVTATQVGRSWYVDPDTVHTHKQTRYRSNQVKSREAIANYKEAVARRAARPTEVHLAVHHYEADESELIPTLGQARREAAPAPTRTQPVEKEVTLSVNTTATKQKFAPAEKATVPFKGSLTVVSAEPSEVLTSTSVTPKATTPARAAEIPKATPRKPVSTKPKTRRSRGQAVAVQTDADTGESVVAIAQTVSTTSVGGRYTLRLTLLAVCVLVLAVLSSAFLQSETEYVAGASTHNTALSTDNIAKYINKNIIILFNR
jgi:hypothetical protein